MSATSGETRTARSATSALPETPFTARSLVAGAWEFATSGGEHVRLDPYRSTPASVASWCSEAEVHGAERWAEHGRSACARLAPFARADILERAAELVSGARTELATMAAIELGKPLRDSLGEMDRAAETLDVAASQARQLGGELLPAEGWQRGAGTTALCFRAPVGTVLAVTPFNAPVNLLAHKIAASFAAGNGTIVKPPPQAPAVSTRFVELVLEAGVPEEGIQLLHGDGVVASALAASRAVQAVAFTGSASAGASIASTAGPKRVVLELGGNAATIVCADTDIGEAARLCAATGYSNSGQSCISVQRVYVEGAVYDEFAAALTEAVGRLRVGDPLDEQTDVGSMVDADAAARVEGWIGEAVAGGAALLAGGRRDGAVLQPTLLGAPPSDAKVLVEEVFGDLVSIVPVADFETAIRLANSTCYGLQTGLFTNDIRRVFSAVRELDVGAIVVNGTSNYRLDHIPFGGVKDSGIGRESPRWLIEDFSTVKTVVFRDMSLWS